MAVSLPLPDPIGLPKVVLFHREHPSEPILTLQVPNPGATDSETYLVRLDREAHRRWMERLKEHRRLMDLLTMEMHVAYEPGDGSVRPLADLDEPGPFVEQFREARRQASRAMGLQRHIHMRRRRVPAISRFRLGLMGRLPSGAERGNC